MGLIVKHSDGSEFLNITNKTYDDVSTSLELPGKGVLNWGEAYVNNFVHLLENFASSTAPRSPQIGQIWYNTGSGILSVYTIGQTWEVINKDSQIEAKLDTLLEELKQNNASAIPPIAPEKGYTWFDTNYNVLKIYNGTEWISFGFNSSATYMEPVDANASDLWFDKNISNLKVYDGKTFQRVVSSVESTTPPTEPAVGQFWTNITTGSIYVYKQEIGSTTYFWAELGSDAATEGAVFPTSATIGALHINRTSGGNILYVNKGSKTQPIWVEIPEFGGAIKSINEPIRAIDGMFWLDGNDNLKIRKSGKWVNIDETAISFVSATIPEKSKEGQLWFDTNAGVLKIKIGTTWKNVQESGIINYGGAPVAPKLGQLWFDNLTSELKIFNATTWNKVNGSSTIVGYQIPAEAANGQFWLDTTSSELKIKKDGRWASLPENARAHLSVPQNPINGDMVYINGKLKVFDGSDWKDINISIDNSVVGTNVSLNYDELSHEIVISSDGITTRVPLAIKRDVIVENVGITSDLVEVVKPNIMAGERRIIDIQNVNLTRPFFVFKNGQFTDSYKVDNKDLVLYKTYGDDEIDLLQFNGDISINYLVKKFVSNVNGSFVIDNYTRTLDEQKAYDVVKAEYNTKLNQLISQLDDNSTIDYLSNADRAILAEIESRLPIKMSNDIADLSLGGIMIFKEGVFIPTSTLEINEENDNKISIPNTNKGEVYTIVQLIVGTDYKSAFHTKEYEFKIGQVTDNTLDSLNTKGSVMSDVIGAASADTSGYGKVNVKYSFNPTTKLVTFELLDINTDYHFCITRNNLLVSPEHVTVDQVNKVVTMYAKDQDDIRFFQFYLPHNYVPVEFNYHEVRAKTAGWITLNLNKDFDLERPLLVFRNGMVQEKENINIITRETLLDSNGNTYTVDGLRKVQIFGDKNTNDESITGIEVGDLITIMQVSQPKVYHIFSEEFRAVTDGFNLFSFNNINVEKDFLIFRNGIKIDNTQYYINADKKLVVKNCNGPILEELATNPNAKGDVIIVYQFYTKDTIANDDLSLTTETVVATVNGAEYFQLSRTEYIKDEFLLVFKNGQLITRRQEDSSDTTQTQINTYKVFAERIFNKKSPALDANGEAILDANLKPVIIVDKDDYTDITAFSLDNVAVNEEISIFQFNKKVANVNNLTSAQHYEIMPQNNIQRIYTTKFSQLSNLTMIFQDGYIIDRTVNTVGQDVYRNAGMLRIIDQYAVDNVSKSIIVNDWKVGGKLRVQQFTAQNKDIQTVTLTVTVAADGTFDVFLPNNETYTPHAGSIEIYIDKVIQWTVEDYQEVANNRVLFTKALKKGQIIKMVVRK